MRRFLLFVGLLGSCIVPVAPADAQTCFGSSPITTSSIHLLGATGFSSSSTMYGVGVVGGSSSNFGQVAVGRLELGEFDRIGAAGLLAVAAAQIAADERRRAVVCPFMQSEYAWANNIKDTRLDGSTGTLLGGLAFGVVAAEGGDVQFVPTFRFGIARSWVRAEFMGQTTTASDTFGIVSLGAGLVMHRRFAMVPLVSWTVGTPAAATSFNLNASIGFGGGQPRAAADRPVTTPVASAPSARAPRPTAPSTTVVETDSPLDPVAQLAMRAYNSCLLGTADRLARSSGSATEIADAAQAECRGEFTRFRSAITDSAAARASRRQEGEVRAQAAAWVEESREAFRQDIVARVLRARAASAAR